MLERLTKLTHLELASGLSAEALEGLGTLAHLQHLKLEGVNPDAATALGEVQELQGLTHLQLEAWHGVVDSDVLPGLSKLTALQTLVLSGDEDAYYGGEDPDNPPQLQPIILGGCTRLEWLLLERFQMADTASGAAELLALLPQMQRLKRLELLEVQLDGAPAAAYSALTANSNLRCLNLQGIIGCSVNELQQCFRPASGWH